MQKIQDPPFMTTARSGVVQNEGIPQYHVQVEGPIKKFRSTERSECRSMKESPWSSHTCYSYCSPAICRLTPELQGLPKFDGRIQVSLFPHPVTTSVRCKFIVNLTGRSRWAPSSANGPFQKPAGIRPHKRLISRRRNWPVSVLPETGVIGGRRAQAA